MEISQTMKKKSFLAIIIAVAALIIVCIVLFMSGFFQDNENYENNEVSENMTIEELNKTLVAELDRIEKRNCFTVTRREVDEEQKNITLYEIYMDDNQIAELQGKEIGGWIITVLPDMDYMKEMDAVEDEIMGMWENPELQIAGSSMTSGNVKEVELWVYNSTPENQALKGRVIHGWTIHVYVCSPLPPKE